ncbi:MAG: hypothetical protein RJA36_2746 [Pseudomonadota bacterium]|jgi:general secretion pathway protein H
MPGHERGFTLLELLVVLAIIGLATAGVSLSLPDSNPLERDAQRLGNLLEAARAHARANAAALEWRPTADGFEFTGAPAGTRDDDDALAPRRWLGSGIQASIERPAGASTLRLGPEPLIPPQTLLLTLGQRQLRLVSDGFQPFRVQAAAPAPP